MRRWRVAGGIVEGEGGLLLVCNRRRDGRTDWSPPGGVIDPGETALGALTREVAEETGLVVGRWAGPVYEIEAEAPDLGWVLEVEVHRAVEVSGVVAVGADPDGIAVDAAWVPSAGCELRLGDAHPWVREPLLEWLGERWAASRRYRYEVRGRPPALQVERR